MLFDGLFHRGLTKDGRSVMNSGTTIPWAEVPDWVKKKKGESGLSTGSHLCSMSDRVEQVPQAPAAPATATLATMLPTTMDLQTESETTLPPLSCSSPVFWHSNKKSNQHRCPLVIICNCSRWPSPWHQARTQKKYDKEAQNQHYFQM